MSFEGTDSPDRGESNGEDETCLIDLAVIRSNTYPDEPDIIKQFRGIVEQKSMGLVEGCPIDLFSASAVIKMYDGVSSDNKSLILKLSPVGMCKLAYKLME